MKKEPRKIKVIDKSGKTLSPCYITRAATMVKRGKAIFLNKDTMQLNVSVA